MMQVQDTTVTTRTSTRATMSTVATATVAAACAVAALGALAGCGGSAPQPKPPTPIQAAPGAAGPAASTPGPATSAPSIQLQTPEKGTNADAVAQRKVSGAQDDASKVEIAGLTMSKPVNWIWTQPTQSMRVLQYAVPAQGSNAPAAELIYTVFTGTDGGPLNSNLDRWAAFFKNDDDTQAPAARTDFEVGALKVHRQESSGKYFGMMGAAAPRPGYAQIGAIVEAPDCRVFIRLVGPKETVASNREAFDAMLKSMK